MALVAIGSEKITVADTAIGLTAAEITSKVVRAFVRVETAEIRINTATTPTAGGAEGSPIKAIDDEFYITGEPDLNSFLAVRTGATSGVLQVIYEGLGGS